MVMRRIRVFERGLMKSYENDGAIVKKLNADKPVKMYGDVLMLFGRFIGE